MVMTVTPEKTALAMGSGTLPVLATPAMAALMEDTAKNSIAEELEEGYTTVGTVLDLKHLAPTPAGMQVSCESVLTAVEGRTFRFTLAVSDEAGPVGEGYHERVMVRADRFLEKANARKAGR